jgi:hypothetical protein
VPGEASDIHFRGKSALQKLGWVDGWMGGWVDGWLGGWSEVGDAVVGDKENKCPLPSFLLAASALELTIYVPRR